MSPALTLLLLVAAQPPGLTVDAAIVDRGDVLGGPVLKQTFRVTNAHPSDTLSLTGLDSTCGCLRRSISRNELKPGETADVTVEINTLTQPDGPQTWLFKLRHRPKDAAKEEPDDEMQLRLKAKLSREVTVSPPMVAITTSTDATTTITLTDKRAKPLSVKALTTTSSLITATLANNQKSIELKFAKDFTAGTHDDMLVITTNDPQYSELRVPIQFIKKSAQAVSILPEILDIELTAGKGSGLVQLRRPDGKALRIASVESKLPGVTVTWSSGSGLAATVKVIVNQSQAGEKGKGELRVKFTEPAGHERAVPITWSGN
jgi:hypothetical protein